MGEIAEAMLEGELCAMCGEYLGDGLGFPGYCSNRCAESAGVDPSEAHVGQDDPLDGLLRRKDENGATKRQRAILRKVHFGTLKTIDSGMGYRLQKKGWVTFPVNSSGFVEAASVRITAAGREIIGV